ncbi:MAG: hypothetical protein AAGK97_15175, partial [Bacteroidota bacterium]
MKYFILPIFCLCTLLINAQEVITVNNFIAGADYNNLQEAIDSASSGDTIYVSGSPLSYGNATVDKPLTLFGEGYLDGLEVYPSVLGNINIGAEADNSHISGFKINQMYSFNDTENLNKIIQFYKKLNSVELLRINVDNITDAFSVFTSLNAKGVPLT